MSQHDIERLPYDMPVKIDPGEYLVGVERIECWTFMGRQPKASLHCRIRQEGEFYDYPVAIHFNINSFKKTRSGHTVNAGWSSNVMRQYQMITGEKQMRKDRIRLNRFKEKLLIAKVVLVTKDREQCDLPEVSQYSTVSKIIKPMEI